MKKKKIPGENGCRICWCTSCKLDKYSCHWFYISHIIWSLYCSLDDHINRLLYQLMNMQSPPWNEQSACLLLLAPLICCKSWRVAPSVFLPTGTLSKGSNAPKPYSIWSVHLLQAAWSLPCNASGLAHVASLTYAMTAGELFPIRFAHQRRREKFFTGS